MLIRHYRCWSQPVLVGDRPESRAKGTQIVAVDLDMIAIDIAAYIPTGTSGLPLLVGDYWQAYIWKTKKKIRLTATPFPLPLKRGGTTKFSRQVEQVTIFVFSSDSLDI